MAKKNVFTKILAIAGTVLVWFPITAPILLLIPRLIRGLSSGFGLGHLNFDYLMPAELFPSFLVGAGLLLWAAIRERSQINIIAWTIGLSILFPVLGSVIATVTGLASGATEPTGWQWALVLAALGLFYLTMMLTGVGGILLLRDLFKRLRA
jgi:MFS family permease